MLKETSVKEILCQCTYQQVTMTAYFKVAESD